VCLCALIAPSKLWAATISFDTAPGALLGGNPVSASATFTTGNGTVDITLTDNLPNPTTVAQLVSSLWFTLSGGQTGTLSSSTGALITINDNGTYIGPGSNVSTGWVLRTSGQQLVLCVICSPTNAPVGPAHLIIGPPAASNIYSGADGSIADNGPHNPFIFETASFHITNSSITANTVVSNVLFGFGTQAYRTVPGYPGDQGDVVAPEPSTFLLVGVMLLSVTLLRKRG
jgi:hypothetical protein